MVIRSRAAAGKNKARGRPPSAALLAQIPTDTIDAVVVDGRTVRGTPFLQLPVGSTTLRAGPQSFFQVHLGMNQRLVSWLAERVAQLQPAALLDLYAGIGNLGLSLAPHVGALTLIESSRFSADDARHNVTVHGVRAEVRTADAHRFQAGDAFFDVALLDPPRMGASGVLSQLSVTRPRAILYVSCDPRALARDLGEAAKVGYTPTELVAFEMFPLTDHVETVAVLTPGGRALSV